MCYYCRKNKNVHGLQELARNEFSEEDWSLRNVIGEDLQVSVPNEKSKRHRRFIIGHNIPQTIA
jgi:hypothetical protein